MGDPSTWPLALRVYLLLEPFCCFCFFFFMVGSCSGFFFFLLLLVFSFLAVALFLFFRMPFGGLLKGLTF